MRRKVPLLLGMRLAPDDLVRLKAVADIEGAKPSRVARDCLRDGIRARLIKLADAPRANQTPAAP